jgi:uncharacterized membrane protein YkvI
MIIVGERYMLLESSWFQRLLLPGFAFKAVVIGGGYATGRELVSFFLPAGPRGGLAGMALAMVLWSLVCTVTFLYAMQIESRDYRTFFSRLLGPLWPAFEIAYCLAIIVTLAVFAAAAGAIGHALFGWPTLAGSLTLMALIALVASLGNEGVEQLFKYVSIFLYVTYGVFLLLSLIHFGPRIETAFTSDIPIDGWIGGGLTYAGYNIVAAVVILPVLRHLRSRRDAITAGLLAGPLAMIPAMFFFISMAGFYPQIRNQLLPSDFLLGELHFPVFRFIFQAMIFAALLESGTGGIHAINERIARAYERDGRRKLPAQARLAVTIVILIGSVFVANRIGLVSLIANGYRFLAYLFLGIYVVPIMTYGLWRVCRRPAGTPRLLDA